MSLVLTDAHIWQGQNLVATVWMHKTNLLCVHRSGDELRHGMVSWHTLDLIIPMNHHLNAKMDPSSNLHILLPAWLYTSPPSKLPLNLLHEHDNKLNCLQRTPCELSMTPSGCSGAGICSMHALETLQFYMSKWTRISNECFHHLSNNELRLLWEQWEVLRITSMLFLIKVLHESTFVILYNFQPFFM